jgi:hypothetical protein
MNNIQFEDAEPTSGPEAKNPYLDVVKSIAGKTREGTTTPLAKSFWHAAPTDDNTVKSLNRIVRLIQDAAKELKYTAKKDVSDPVIRDTESNGYKPAEDGKPSAKYVRVTFWTVDQIVKKRRTKEEIAAEKNAATPAAATPAKTAPAAVKPVSPAFKAPATPAAKK